MAPRQLIPCPVGLQSCHTLYEELGIGQGFCTTFSSSSRVPFSGHAKFASTKGCHQLTMSKKIVIKADLVGKTCMRDIMTVASTLQGIKSMEIDAEKCTLTVVGTVDPVRIAQRLTKKCFAATIISVADDKPKEPKDPCKEACEKLCKEKCDKITCCKECKEKCEKACKERCEGRCKRWLESGCCSCSCGYTPWPCAVPSYPYCSCGRGCGGCPGPFGC
ncbi:hypothetical protein BAE44_0005042 [Dichanthelium oligosanthes]|uniref:HMA domain-containing protein n=1 Tax=Dichanthelium oligosanthes TaxID=888268 RepID=A0A1E5W9A2_9POAL|nr:hypothetical protein BAE44_0005042 [Dichanthelium oligosanthes]